MEQFGVLALGSRMKRLSDFLFSEVQAVYNQASTQISATYFPILRLLNGSSGLGIVDISMELGLSHPAISKQVNKMIKDGLLVKVASEKDQRKSVVCLSEEAMLSMSEVEPILKAIGSEVTLLLEAQPIKTTFIESFSNVEREILHLGLTKQVVTQCKYDNQLFLEPYSSRHGTCFYDLNMAWLESHFMNQIEPQDFHSLGNPEKVVEEGGEVWCAVDRRKGHEDAQVIGVFALKPRDKLTKDSIELSKMTVTPSEQGNGVGRYMLTHAFRRARALDYKTLCLESARKLKSAIHLYDSFGFKEVNVDKFSYHRTDVYMALDIQNPHKRGFQ
ncbi:bifunctional helix-turn-helix transcriptional regulator/GNAT family N-acetyltransferase [Marinomonas balearica]|uniref:DNA-binding MarR family transcriptional regulator n=1 Tax=Marinomonas balearica TaxID=491947 RepID=A0A4V3CH27_9GAMM|nr:GNAT family N-acetyltransferase [Marinomonas balearica]TDP00013.1 DNA-binding MarR family transcriptional regulator [Marinomonas balearica]